MAEQVGIIKKVGIGCRDIGSPVLWFDVYVSEGTGSLQVLSWDEAYEVLKSVEDVRDLEGKPCWVEVDGNLMKFKRLWTSHG